MDKETAIVFLTLFADEPEKIEEYAEILITIINKNISFKNLEDGKQ